ncbi:hypothetical protein AB0K02_33475 [Streptomyces sp. NPDC049597]|uniref:hypothetical protein n=1 Tax=Streptomyces sp. NPDC049597 TaxID=3155276 RepID=UPI003432690C
MPKLRTAVAVAAVISAATAVPSAADPAPQRPVACNEDALKDAIRKANEHGGGEFWLTPGCTYGITTPASENTALPAVISEITIHGQESTIKRESAKDFRLFLVDSPFGDLTLNNVTVRDGRAENGGGIWVRPASRLTINESKIINNVAGGLGARPGGGGIDNFSGSVTLRDSILNDNTSSSHGGGMFQDGTATVVRSTISGNTAGDTSGGIRNNTGRLTVNDSVISGNTSHGGGGGGISNGTGGTTTLNDSTVIDNTATHASSLGGGIGNRGRLFLNRSHVRDNRTNGKGGGIAQRGNDPAATLEDSSVTGNIAAAAPGGIYSEEGPVRLLSTIVADNQPTNCSGSPDPVPGCPD